MSGLWGLGLWILSPWLPSSIRYGMKLIFFDWSRLLRGFGTASCEVTVIMTLEALKRNLFVVQLLDMAPVPQGELNGFRKTFLEVNLNKNASAGKLVPFRLRPVQETPKLISNVLQRTFPPEMQGKVRQPNPDRGCDDLGFGVEVKSPGG